MGHQPTLQNQAGLSTGRGRGGHDRGLEVESRLAQQPSNWSFKNRFKSPGSTGTLPTLPVDLGTTSKTGRAYPVESKSKWASKTFAQLLHKTLYEANSQSLRQVKMRLKRKVDSGDPQAGMMMDTLQKQMGIYTHSQDKQLSEYTGGKITSLDQFNRQVGYDSKNAIAGLRERQRGLSVFAGGFVPNFYNAATQEHFAQGREFENWVGTILGTAPGYNTPMDFSKVNRSRLRTKKAKAHMFNPELYGPGGVADAHKGGGHTSVQSVGKVINHYSTDVEDIRPYGGTYTLPSNYTEIIGVGADRKREQSTTFGALKKYKSKAYRGLMDGLMSSFDDKTLKVSFNQDKVSRQIAQPQSKARRRSAGFIPNFSAITDAFATEKALGGKPILDYDPRIGLFVRDDKTQKNFGDVLKDHPEGIGKAVKNSKAMQDALAAEGHVPNFAEGGTGFDMAIITGGMMMLGSSMMQLSDRHKEGKAAFEELTNKIKTLDETETKLNEEFKKAEEQQKRHTAAVKADAEAIRKKEAELKNASSKGHRTRDAKKEAIAEMNEQRAKKGGKALTAEEEKDLKAGKKGGNTQKAFNKRLQRIQEEKEQAIKNEIQALKKSKQATDDQAKASKELVEKKKEEQRAHKKNVAQINREAHAHNQTASTSNQITGGAGKQSIAKAGKMTRFGSAAQGASMPMMMAMPMVGGLAKSAGVNEQAVSGVETGANIFAMGAMTGNPYAAAAAGIVGLGVAAGGALNAMNDPLPELKKNAEQAKEKFTKLSNASQTYLSAFDKLEAGMKSENIKPDELVKQQDALTDAFMDLPDDIRAKFAHVKGDAESIKKFFSEANKELQEAQRQAEGRVQFQEMYDEERGWFVDWVRKVGGAEEKGDRMFGTGRSGEKRQANYASLLSREVDKDELKGKGGTANLKALSNFVDNIGTKMSPEELREMVAHMRELGIPQGYIEDFEAVAKNSEDGAEAAKDLAKNLNKTKEAMIKTAKASALIAVNKAIGDKYRESLKKLTAQQKSVNAALKTTMSIEKQRVDQMNKLRLSRDNFQLDMAQTLAAGSLDTAKPFMGKVETSRVETDLKLAKMRADEIKKIREAVTKSNTAAFNITQDQVMKAAQTLESSIAGKVGQNETNKIWKDVQENQHIVAKLTPIMVEHLQKIKDNPDAAALPEKLREKLEVAFEKAGASNAKASANVIIKQLESNAVALEGDLQKIFDETANQTIIMGLTQKNQEESIKLQEKLASFGGGSGFLARGEFGETNISGEFQKVKEDLYNAILPLVDQRAAGVAGAQESTPGLVDSGRAAFKTLDLLINKMALRTGGTGTDAGTRMGFDDFGPLAGRAVAGRAASIRMDIGQARRVSALQGADVGPDSDLGKAFKAADEGAENTAIMQIAKEFKFDEMPDQMAQMNERMGILNEIIANQASDLEMRNKAAFTAALQAVGMDKLADNFNEDIVKQTNALGDASKANAQDILKGSEGLDGAVRAGTIANHAGHAVTAAAVDLARIDASADRGKQLSLVGTGINNAAKTNFQNLDKALVRGYVEVGERQERGFNGINKVGFNLILDELRTLNKITDKVTAEKDKKAFREEFKQPLIEFYTDQAMKDRAAQPGEKATEEDVEAAKKKAIKTIESETLMNKVFTPGSDFNKYLIEKDAVTKDKMQDLAGGAVQLSGSQKAEGQQVLRWQAYTALMESEQNRKLKGKESPMGDITAGGRSIGSVFQQLDWMGMNPKQYKNVDEFKEAITVGWDKLSKDEKKKKLLDAYNAKGSPNAEKVAKNYDWIDDALDVMLGDYLPAQSAKGGRNPRKARKAGRHVTNESIAGVIKKMPGFEETLEDGDWWAEKMLLSEKDRVTEDVGLGTIFTGSGGISGGAVDWTKSKGSSDLMKDQLALIAQRAKRYRASGQNAKLTMGDLNNIAAGVGSTKGPNAKGSVGYNVLTPAQKQDFLKALNEEGATENIDNWRRMMMKHQLNPQGPTYTKPTTSVTETVADSSLTKFNAENARTYRKNDIDEGSRVRAARSASAAFRMAKLPLEMIMGATGAGATEGQYRVGQEGYNLALRMGTTQRSGAHGYDSPERQIALRRNQNLLAYTRRQNMQLGEGYLSKTVERMNAQYPLGSPKRIAEEEGLNIYKDTGFGKQIDTKKVDYVRAKLGEESGRIKRDQDAIAKLEKAGVMWGAEEHESFDALAKSVKAKGFEGDVTDFEAMKGFLDNAAKDVKGFSDSLERVKEYGKTYITMQGRVEELKKAAAKDSPLSKEEILKAYGVDQLEKARAALDEAKKKVDLLNNDPSATIAEKIKSAEEVQQRAVDELRSRAAAKNMDMQGKTLKELSESNMVLDDGTSVGEAVENIVKSYLNNVKDKLDDDIKNLENTVWLEDQNKLMYEDEKSANKRALTKKRMQSGDYSIKDTMSDIAQSWKYNGRMMKRDAEENLYKISQSFQSETTKAFSALIDGTKSAKEAFGDLTEGIGKMATDMLIEMMVKRYIFNPLSKFMGGAQGGLVGDRGIQRFAEGGFVRGGSGVKDDVSALLSKGEFVVKKSSVNKYGMSFLNSLNSGEMPRGSSPDPQANLSSLMDHHQNNTGAYAKFNLRNAFVYDSDKPLPTGASGYAIDPRMSRQGLTDPDNPRNKFRMEKVQKLYDYWASRRQELDEWRKSVDDFKKMRKRSMRNALLLGFGATAMGSLFGGDYGATFGKGKLGAKAGLWSASAGGHNKKDNIPAMLMGGEYVVNAGTVNRYGVDFFRKLNEGRLRTYADGGLVGTEPANTSQMPSDQTLGATNNVTINVNVERGGSVTATAGGLSNEEGENLANLIKDQVVKTIVNEKRQGGILYN
jgi:hypothetical protein